MKYKKRKKAIEETAKEHGLKKGNKYIIGFWDLAEHLNNHWKAKDFVRKNGKEMGVPYLDNENHFCEFSIQHWAVSVFHKPIQKTINKMKNAKIIQTKRFREYYEIEVTK